MTLREKLESGDTLTGLERATLVLMLEEQDHLRKWARIGQRLHAKSSPPSRDNSFRFPTPPKKRGGRR